MTMHFQQQTFLPPAIRRAAPVAVPAVTMLGAAPALAVMGFPYDPPAKNDPIGEAAAKLSKAAYPFMQEVDWNSNLYNLNPGSKDAVSWAKAIGKMIDMGASMDTAFLKEGVLAHHTAIQASANGKISEAQLTKINAAIGHMIASVPESKTMAVYNSVKELVDPKVPAYLMSTVKEADAKAAYSALIEFTKVVKTNPITPAKVESAVSTEAGDSIKAAASKLSGAAYPLIKDVDWTSDLYSKPIPGKAPQDVMKAIDKMILMGAAMDGAALKEAAQAHVKAINGVDEKGVLSQADFEAINAGLGKAISSVPTSKVMDVYNAMNGLIGDSPIPNYLFSQVKAQDAQAAYNALLQFKDVVKASQVVTDVRALGCAVKGLNCL